MSYIGVIACDVTARMPRAVRELLALLPEQSAPRGGWSSEARLRAEAQRARSGVFTLHVLSGLSAGFLPERIHDAVARAVRESGWDASEPLDCWEFEPRWEGNSDVLVLRPRDCRAAAFIQSLAAQFAPYLAAYDMERDPAVFVGLYRERALSPEVLGELNAAWRNPEVTIRGVSFVRSPEDRVLFGVHRYRLGVLAGARRWAAGLCRRLRRGAGESQTSVFSE